MPEISFAAHISLGEAIERRNRSPYIPGAVKTDVACPSSDGNTHANMRRWTTMTASGPQCRRQDRARGSGWHTVKVGIRDLRATRPHLARRVCRRAAPRSCATSPDGTSHPAANHCFPL